MPTIHWFRRDLRVADNPALCLALQQSADSCIPLFILDDAIVYADDTAPARVAFLLESLQALDQSLRARGSRLHIMHGPAITTLRSFAQNVGATAVFWNRDYTPYAMRRDQQAEQALRELGIAVTTTDDATILPPGAIRTAEGRAYTVFTPFKRAWRARVDYQLSEILAEWPIESMAPPPADLRSDPLPSLADLGLSVSAKLLPGGEAAGLQRLAEFAIPAADSPVASYASARDYLSQAGTSRLSPYLRLGCVAPRAALRAAFRVLEQTEPGQAAALSVETWISELAWRDFYYQIMVNFPHVLRSAFRPQYDALQWENRADWFAAWQTGQTGYPVVDAAMRQLQQEAWMHNRARMIVASFLTKDLLIDWRWGERHFMRMLVDGDHASNNGGWQWAAGTGTDAQPYFRIFNPVSQGQKFDPNGVYVRRYVPELANLPDAYIHSPWRMAPAEQSWNGVIIGRDYPAPIVDHAVQRTRALEMYQKVR